MISCPFCGKDCSRFKLKHDNGSIMNCCPTHGPFFYEEIPQPVNEKNVTTEATQLANDHWAYISALLKVHGLVDEQIAELGFHYVSAFIHGFKHGVEFLQK